VGQEVVLLQSMSSWCGFRNLVMRMIAGGLEDVHTLKRFFSIWRPKVKSFTAKVAEEIRRGR